MRAVLCIQLTLALQCVNEWFLLQRFGVREDFLKYLIPFLLADVWVHGGGGGFGTL